VRSFVFYRIISNGDDVGRGQDLGRISAGEPFETRLLALDDSVDCPGASERNEQRACVGVAEATVARESSLSSGQRTTESPTLVSRDVSLNSGILPGKLFSN